MEVAGLGIHRIWWVGGRYAYASALLDGRSYVVPDDVKSLVQERGIRFIRLWFTFSSSFWYSS